jgi:uncharacterized membrane protein YgdD (TMEM256/DUF423 family)
MALTQNGSGRNGNVDRLVAFSIAAAGISGVMGVGFGAFAAHGLASLGDPVIVDWVKTGASYQLWHAAALLGLSCLTGRLNAGLLRAVAGCFFLGALLFGGSLYVLALLHWSWVVFVTPIGGMLMLIGWALLIVGGWRHGKRSA